MDESAEPVVIAIDPGRAKCGVAVVSKSGSVAERAVIDSATLTSTIADLLTRYTPAALILGDGTHSAAARAGLRDATGAVPLVTVDEKHTSEEARRRFITDNQPSGLKRLVPLGLRTPDRPYDDYVAVILAERWWRDQAETQG